MTHYIPAYAPVNGVRVQAICSRYVFYSDHALAPTCPECHALILEQERHDADEDAAIQALRDMPDRPSRCPRSTFSTAMRSGAADDE